MDTPILADQQNLTFISSVWILEVAKRTAQANGAVEYTDCISAEG